MPGGLPLGFEICNMPSGYNINAGSSSSNGITPSGTANTKGSWTQMVAATDNDACTIVVIIESDNGGAVNYSLDIGVGAGGSEKILVADLMASTNSNSQPTSNYFTLPVQIPSGTRVSARSQSSGTSQAAIGVALYIGDGAFTQLEGAAGVDAIGFASSTTLGTAVTSANGSKGTYAQLTASTARDYVGLMFSMDYQGSTTIHNSNWLADIAVGAGGSETIIIPNYQMRSNTQGIFNPQSSAYFPIQVPSGTRLAARLQSDTGVIAVGMTAYGVYY